MLGQLELFWFDGSSNAIRIQSGFSTRVSWGLLLSKTLDDDRCRFLAGNVRDKDWLERAVDGIDILVHTAAMKHVDICEYNPFEGVQTNVVGLQNLIKAAIDADVDRFIFTSSDKAIRPANTMGTTKLLG